MSGSVKEHSLLDGMYFKCPTSSKVHQGLPDLVNDAPAAYYALEDHQRERRAVLHSDFCIIDEAHYYIRCVLEIPIKGTQTDRLGWGIWCQVDAADFEKYGESFTQDRQSHIGSLEGMIANTLSGYPETHGLPCRIVPKDGGMRPVVALDEGTHILVSHQKVGISMTQAVGFASQVMVSDKPLSAAH